jgi:hypothetical protein
MASKTAPLEPRRAQPPTATVKDEAPCCGVRSRPMRARSSCPSTSTP